VLVLVVVVEYLVPLVDQEMVDLDLVGVMVVPVRSVEFVVVFVEYLYFQSVDLDH
jgi:hypothetical protein